jgi:MoaA/NifB/PqqE/SkfB family radical SAM enzyme
LKGDALISGVLSIARRFRPLHISIVGGEPLVRYRELDVVLPQLETMGIEVQLVTSAVRPIPLSWKALANLHLVVSIDGLQPEHDKRRSPATYDRILKHIEGHEVVVHCTVTRQQIRRRQSYLSEFAAFWSERKEIRKIWFSLYTPQEGDESEERLTPEDRKTAVAEIRRLRDSFPKVDSPNVVLDGLSHPPASPQECIFAQTTQCISADLTTHITPCQFGGKPVCSECGCIASAGLASVGKYKLGGVLPVSRVFALSKGIGDRVRGVA